MVGGDAGGSSIGVAPDAKWIAVKIFNDQGVANAVGIHLGFQWLLDPDGDPGTPDAPNVVNNSWTLSSARLQSRVPARPRRTCAPRASSRSSPPGTAGRARARASARRTIPARSPSGLRAMPTRSASSSSRGPSSCGQPVYPQVVAPGVSIRSSDLFGLYARMSGTSLAAPHVSGALALLLSASPGLLPDRQEAALESGAVDLGAAGADDTFGFGRLDVLAAYQWLQGSPPPPPPPDFTIGATPALGDHARGRLGVVRRLRRRARTGSPAMSPSRSPASRARRRRGALPRRSSPAAREAHSSRSRPIRGSRRARIRSTSRRRTARARITRPSRSWCRHRPISRWRRRRPRRPSSPAGRRSTRSRSDR